jgi:hypothetical protein
MARSRARSAPVSIISIHSTPSTSGITSNSSRSEVCSTSLSRVPLTTTFVSSSESIARSRCLSQSKQLSTNSRRTPKQNQAFEKEKREAFNLKNEAHVWAISEIKENKKEATRKQLSVEEWAQRASERFDLQVRGDTLRHMIRSGNTNLQ